METFALFCLIFVLYISSSTEVFIALFFVNKFIIKYSALLPQKNFKLNNWCPFIEQKNQKYLIWTYFYISMHIIVFVFFVLLWTLIWKNLWYLISFILIFILLSIFIFLSIKKYWNNIKFLGYCTYQQSFENILKYYKFLNINDNDQSINLIVYKNNYLFNKFTNLIINKNKSFSVKIGNANNKNEIINLFNAYLKGWSYFTELISKNYPTYKFRNSKNNLEEEEIYKIIWKNFFIWLHHNKNFKKM